MPTRSQSFFACALLLTFALAASADVIKMSDGRQFEGTVVATSNDSISIDTVVSTVRVTLKLNRAEIASHDKKPVRAGFYDPAPADARISDPTKFADPGSVYLEVPIKGEFGKDVYAAGVRQIIAYARAHRIGHLVFVVESNGGDLDEAREIYDLIRGQFGKIRMHAIVANCMGDAMAVPAACDTINLLPGSSVGGLGRRLAEISDKLAKEDEMVLRRQLANELEATAKLRGRNGKVIRAMVDPTESLAAWKTAEGEVKMDTELPADVPKDKVIFNNNDKSLLVLTYDQAIALGLPAFKGGAADLGKQLDISQWSAESDYGITTMKKIAAEKTKAAEAAQSMFDGKVKNNVTRRESADRAIQENMKQASDWAPTKESYATYKYYGSRWNWGWGYGGGGEGIDSNRLTNESRKKWRDRTDACMYFLLEARSAMKTMQRLDKEAVTLGLPATYKPEDLDYMLKDLEVKVVYLNNHRNRTSN